MPLTQVQVASGQSAANVASQSATFASPPTSGNLLRCWANADTTLTMTSSGWTLAWSSLSFVGLYQWYKIAGASESSTVTVTPASSLAVQLFIREDSGNTATPLDRTSTSTAPSASSSVPSGTTAATTQADEHAAAAFGWNNASAVVTASTYTNSFTEIHETVALGTTQVAMAVAELVLSATATQTTTVTLSAANNSQKSGGIATYKASGGGGATVVKNLSALGVG